MSKGSGAGWLVGGGLLLVALVASAGPPTPAPSPKAPLPQGRRILLVGDSLSVGKHSPGGKLAALFRQQGATVTVNALGGRSALSFAKGSTKGESAAGTVQLHNDLAKHKPHTVLFHLGTNDEANIAEGSAQKPQVEALKELIAFVSDKEAYPFVEEVILVGPPDFSPKLSQYKKHSIPEIAPSYVAAVSSLGVPFVDGRPLSSDLVSSEFRPVDKKSGRGIHFTAKAAKTYAERLYTALTGEPAPSPVSTLENVLRWAPDMKAAIAEEESKLPLDIALATMHLESGGNPRLTSSAGAKGLMQLMPGTAEMWDIKDPFDPQASILGGVKTFDWIMPKYKGAENFWERVLGAYNAGPGNVPKKGDGYKRRAEYYEYILARVPLYHQELKERGLL